MRADRRVWFVGAAVLIGLALRWWVLRSGFGTLNADEAVTGLGAVEASRGRFDVVIPGNAYTANLESYLFAPVVMAVGAHVVPLKLMPIALWGAACLVCSHLARRVGLGTGAVAVGLTMWCVPGALLVLSTRAYLAYAGGLLMSSLALLALAVVARMTRASARPSAVAGLATGLAIYGHPMYAALLIPAAAAVGWIHRGSWRTWWVPFGLSGLAMNVPFVVWNVVHGFPSLDPGSAGRYGTFRSRLTGFFGEMLPRDLGLLNVDGTKWTIGQPAGVLVLSTFLFLGVCGTISLSKASAAGRVIAVSALAVWPLMALLPPLGFVDDGRYGIVPLPTMMVAVVAGVVDIARRLRNRSVAARRIPSVLAFGWIALCVMPYQLRVIGTTFIDPNRNEAAVLRALRAAEINHLSGSHRGVLPVAYMADGLITIGVSRGEVVRYPLQQRIVESVDPSKVAFLFRPIEEDSSVLYLPAEYYRRLDLPGYTLLLPPGAG